LTLAGFVSLSEPGETILIANFPTSDPVARRKLRREYRKAFHRAHEKEGIPVQLPRKRAAP
jgi:hypothetical protein